MLCMGFNATEKKIKQIKNVEADLSICTHNQTFCVELECLNQSHTDVAYTQAAHMIIVNCYSMFICELNIQIRRKSHWHYFTHRLGVDLFRGRKRISFWNRTQVFKCMRKLSLFLLNTLLPYRNVTDLQRYVKSMQRYVKWLDSGYND